MSDIVKEGDTGYVGNWKGRVVRYAGNFLPIDLGQNDQDAQRNGTGWHQRRVDRFIREYRDRRAWWQVWRAGENDGP